MKPIKRAIPILSCPGAGAGRLRQRRRHRAGAVERPNRYRGGGRHRRRLGPPSDRPSRPTPQHRRRPRRRPPSRSRSSTSSARSRSSPSPSGSVSIGFADQDWLLALGVTPIAIREWYGEFPYATWPWAQDELGDAQPEVLPSTELNFEQIAALRPRPDRRRRLGDDRAPSTTSCRQIAPTLAQPGDYIDYGTPWDVTTKLIGEAVGKRAEAAAMIEHVDALYAAARAAHPEFDGSHRGGGVLLRGHARAPTPRRTAAAGSCTDLGFTIPPEFDELAGDAVLLHRQQRGDRHARHRRPRLDRRHRRRSGRRSRASPTRPSLRAYAEGRELLTDTELGGAFSFGSPLSIEYLLEQLVPELALAVDGDPATAVPSAAGDPRCRAPDRRRVAAAAALDAEAAGGRRRVGGSVRLDRRASTTRPSIIEDAAALQATVESYAAAGVGDGGHLARYRPTS